MDLRLAGKTALITGASKGLGLGCALELAAEGCHLHLASRTRTDLEGAREQIARKSDVRVTIHPLDLGDMSNCRKLADACGDVDILVNNAGAIPSGTLESLSEADWRTGWELKVFGYVALTRAIYPRMRARGGGVIVNILGIHGDRPKATHLASASGNAALAAVTKALGTDSQKDGIRVVGVSPGYVHTDRVTASLKRRARTEFGDESRWTELLANLPSPGTVEQVADLVTYMASERAAHITGTIVTIDGGASGRY